MAANQRIDVQHHILPQPYLEAVGREALARTLVSGRCPDWTPDTSLTAMDRHGIDRAILSLAAPGYHFDDPTAAAELARRCNDFSAALCRDHPARFGFFATLPLPHVDAALEELARVHRDLPADGVVLLTNYDGLYLGDPALDPVLDEVDRLGLVAFVHPADLPPGRPLPHIPAATLEFPFDTTRAITNLVFSGSMTRLRRLRFIFSHAGGTLPLLADRIGRLHRRPEFAEKAPDGFIAEIRRHYYDIALSAGPRTLQPLLDTVPVEQVLFASDFPHAGEDTMAGTIKALHGQRLSAATLQAIEGGNAGRLFGTARAEPATG
ncbi:amidohydrolase family protein [Aquicoccus sp. SCR17]|nr:amidohydrolase family protein [Carideicomes alvinocaridis]